jgi:hypothetical protein
VRDFDRVTLTGLGEVILTQGAGESLTIETDKNVMPYVTSEVKGGMLTLGIESGILARPTRLEFTLGVTNLEGLTVSGSGQVSAERLAAGRLDIRVSGSGDVRIAELTAAEVEVQISGSGDVELAGEVTEQAIAISGSGKYRGKDLESETTAVTVSGSGDADVWVTEFLDARLTGSGSVNYYGDPRMNILRSDSGKLVDRGTK